MAMLQVSRLTKYFGAILAVDNVSFSVDKGEVVGFLGPNGAGKTTTVRMLVTLLAPSAGRAWVAGRDVVADPGGVRLRIGVALQEAALDPERPRGDGVPGGREVEAVRLRESPVLAAAAEEARCGHRRQ